MGVPKFYRWLSERYPQINQIINESSMLPEIDNFYLDMNGIIHNCTHPGEQDVSKALTLGEMMRNVFRYLDRCVGEIVRPKRLLFIAIDGVAPRAKLNQQRARRFRSAQEREDSVNKARQRGEAVDEGAMFDSNCITPGTEFMETVSKHIKWFIRKKIKEDAVWKNLEIIFSGADVPGEGEHKIMQYIRDQRCKPGYAPNIRHCMYGQDADLIMLALATHEPHFTLLREVINFNSNFGGRSVRQTVIRQTREAQFQLLHISVLREYIEVDIARDFPFALDKERLIDDFIFMTFLVGNDFLPHLPTLDISEHAFDTIFEAYKTMMREDMGYLIEEGEIKDFNRLEKFFKTIGEKENEILLTRDSEMKRVVKKSRKMASNMPSLEELEEAEEALEKAYQDAILEALGKDPEGDSALLEMRTGPFMPVEVSRRSKAKKGGADVDSDDELEGVPAKDYRGRYYFEKFRVLPGVEKTDLFLNTLMEKYLEGLLWCFAYYSKGCISWTWYFPYHYGPMLQDMKGLSEKASKISFSLGQPFLPFQQLLGCLPPGSKSLLPRSYQWLMTSKDSPVIEYYPEEFGVDMNGKKSPWEAVILLPFIDEKRLLAAEQLYCPAHLLVQKELNRNVFGKLTAYRFDPGVTATYFSCNPEIGLEDITKCMSRSEELDPDLTSGHFFVPVVVPGTISPYPGFPSLSVMQMQSVELESVKVNVFGSESKYRSLILGVAPIAFDENEMDKSILAELVGRTVYVNFPMSHEAKVVAVTTKSFEYRQDSISGEVNLITYDRYRTEKWLKESEEESLKYLKGRGLPGSGGLAIGSIEIRLRVLPLQGMKKNVSTGARKKIFGNTEADVPLQLVNVVPPSIVDKRFEETEEIPLEELLPFGTKVIGTQGRFRGQIGTVVGPHDATGKKVSKQPGPRTVDVEFSFPPPESPFGKVIAQQIQDDYCSAREACRLLKISSSVLGQIVGSVFVEGTRVDLGLNLKRNGVYYCPGYVRVNEDEDGPSDKKGAWKLGDAVQVVGSVEMTAEDAEKETSRWEYSARAITLILEYMTYYPQLFEGLAKSPYGKHSPLDLFGADGARKAEEIHLWIESLPIKSVPRTPFSTISMSKDAMKAVERAGDTLTAARAANPPEKIVVSKVPVDHLFYDDNFSFYDAPLTYNCQDEDGKEMIKPQLGDRIVNLNSIGVTFGLRGTVVTIHETTGFVEVIFDEEFTGGKTLHGYCSPFRGRLVPWTGVLHLADYVPAVQPAATKREKKKELTDKQMALLSKIGGGKATNPVSASDGASGVAMKAPDKTTIVDKKEALQKVLKIATSVDGGKVEAGPKKKKDISSEEVAKKLAQLKVELNIGAHVESQDHQREVLPPLPPPPEIPSMDLRPTAKELRQHQIISDLLKTDESDPLFDILSKEPVPVSKKSDGSGAAALLAAASQYEEEEAGHLSASPSLKVAVNPTTLLKRNVSEKEKTVAVASTGGESNTVSKLASLKALLGKPSQEVGGGVSRDASTAGKSTALLKSILKPSTEEGSHQTSASVSVTAQIQDSTVTEAIADSGTASMSLMEKLANARKVLKEKMKQEGENSSASTASTTSTHPPPPNVNSEQRASEQAEKEDSSAQQKKKVELLLKPSILLSRPKK